MEILIVTNSCSDEKYKKIMRIRNKNTLEPQQKFFRLFIDGLAENKGANISVMSVLPISSSLTNKYFFKQTKEFISKKLNYTYLGFFNGKFSRYITLCFSSIKYLLKWCNKNKKMTSVIIVDPLIPIVSIPSRIIATIYGIKTVALITDLPTLSTSMKERKEFFLKKSALTMYQFIAHRDLYYYDGYIPITETINKKINVHKRPYVIIEGFADSQDESIEVNHNNYIMYAGGVYEKYGVKNLVEAFIKLKNEDVELFIFGEGTYIEEIKKIHEKHKNIRYMGCVSTEEIVKYEKRALLLVNPRPINEEFAKYSFPSKTIEYMLSGTAVVSTKLLGIPKEYFDYIYSFEDDTVNGIYKTLKKILSYSKEVLVKKGKLGHDFIFENKNNIIMAKKVFNFLEKGIINGK